jgi:hypothetical protein
LGVLNLKFDDLFAVARGKSAPISQIFIQLIQILLLFDLLIQHVLSLCLFFLQALHHICGSFLCELQRILNFLNLFSLSIELASLLLSLCHSAALNLRINVTVIFVDFALLSEDVSDLVDSHLLQAIEILDATLSN